MKYRFPGSPVRSRRRGVAGCLCSLGVVVSLLAVFAQSVWGQSVVTNDKRVGSGFDIKYVAIFAQPVTGARPR